MHTIRNRLAVVRSQTLNKVRRVYCFSNVFVAELFRVVLRTLFQSFRLNLEIVRYFFTLKALIPSVSFPPDNGYYVHILSIYLQYWIYTSNIYCIYLKCCRHSFIPFTK